MSGKTNKKNYFIPEDNLRYEVVQEGNRGRRKTIGKGRRKLKWRDWKTVGRLNGNG